MGELLIRGPQTGLRQPIDSQVGYSPQPIAVPHYCNCNCSIPSMRILFIYIYLYVYVSTYDCYGVGAVAKVQGLFLERHPAAVQNEGYRGVVATYCRD